MKSGLETILAVKKTTSMAYDGLIMSARNPWLGQSFAFLIVATVLPLGALALTPFQQEESIAEKDLLLAAAVNRASIRQSAVGLLAFRTRDAGSSEGKRAIESVQKALQDAGVSVECPSDPMFDFSINWLDRCHFEIDGDRFSALSSVARLPFGSFPSESYVDLHDVDARAHSGRSGPGFVMIESVAPGQVPESFDSWKAELRGALVGLVLNQPSPEVADDAAPLVAEPDKGRLGLPLISCSARLSARLRRADRSLTRLSVSGGHEGPGLPTHSLCVRFGGSNPTRRLIFYAGIQGCEGGPGAAESAGPVGALVEVARILKAVRFLQADEVGGPEILIMISAYRLPGYSVAFGHEIGRGQIPTHVVWVTDLAPGPTDQISLIDASAEPKILRMVERGLDSHQGEGGFWPGITRSSISAQTAKLVLNYHRPTSFFVLGGSPPREFALPVIDPERFKKSPAASQATSADLPERTFDLRPQCLEWAARAALVIANRFVREVPK